MENYQLNKRMEKIYDYLSKEGFRYRIENDGTSFSIHAGNWDKTRKIKRTDHGSRVETVNPHVVFNRGIKRGETILVTGDKPRFAMLRTLPLDTLCPDFIKLGDGRIRIKYKEHEKWLDNATDIHTFFHPWGTEYRVTFDYLPGIKFSLTVTQAEDWGAVIKLLFINNSTEPVNLNTDFIYGGISTKCGRTLTAEYFPADSNDHEGNKATISDDLVLLSKDEIPVKAFALSSSDIKPVLVDCKAGFSNSIYLYPGEKKSLYYTIGNCNSDEDKQIKLRESEAESLIKESISYYDTLISKSTISTPSMVLNTGFRTAVLNLEHNYGRTSWLEGVHCWVAPWVNNYQISAAISLGQVERAVKALEFFGLGERGPCPIVMASGKPLESGVHDTEDGLPYYLYTLLQYYEHTGDQELLERLWTNLSNAIKHMFKVRNSNKNGLLDFHLGCNAFMYQADHLQMPGDAASPSLMMAGMLERLSVVAERIGKTEDGANWKSLSESMYFKIKELLWNSETGVFYNHVDLQGIKHMAHYYTDLIFPVLYTSLNKEYGWQSMDYLSRNLCFENEDADLTLMRVGNFKPTIFGSDNVMPTQMSEAARAYFKTGDNERGIRLLESVALAGSIYTEAPGNFPERMSDEGKGEANYIFGNPIGSFIYAVTEGLFGLSLTDGSNTTRWSPSFPNDWDHAELNLSYAGVSFTKSTDTFSSNAMKRIYTITSDKERNLDFSVNLEPCRIKNVYCNGSAVEYKVIPGLKKTKLGVFCSECSSYEIVIDYIPVTVEISGMEVCGAGSKVSWEFSLPVSKVSDPQGALYELTISGNSIKGKAEEKMGPHMIFVELQYLPVIYPVCFEIQPIYKFTCESAVYDFDDKSVNIGIRTLDLAPVVEKAELSVEVLNQSLSISLKDLENTSVLKYIKIFDMEMPPEGVYEVAFKVSYEGRIVYKSRENMNLVGIDDKASMMMRELRDRLTSPQDISSFYNSSTIWATSRWRSGTDLGIDLKSIASADGSLKTVAGTFKPSFEEQNIALIEFGRTHPYTCEMSTTERPNCLSIPVGKNVQMVSLLYASEVASRHTGSMVGTILLQYKDGNDMKIPLIVGKNIDSLYTHFAEDTIPINVLKNTWDDDNINILRLPCNPDKVLYSIKIHLDVADTQFGLLGMSVISDI